MKDIADHLDGSAPQKRFAINLDEISGALGDLGTFLPHIVGAITVVGMDPSGLLSTFGAFYAFSGIFYGVPMAVQPMKAASAAVLIEPLDPGSVAGAGIIIGIVFLLLGVTGVIGKIARALPQTIASGLQLGLGLSLAALGIRLVETQIWLGLVIAALMLVLMRFQRVPVALLAVITGVVAGQVFGLSQPLQGLTPGLHLPHLVIPDWEQIVHGTIYAVLPQVPLTLTNAIIVTVAITHQLFPNRQTQVTEKNLAITTGLGNLLSAPFGGYLMCHGAGGIVGHVRFGARTGTAPVLIGVLFLSLGIFFGASGYSFLKSIPDAVLGGLLLFSGIELAVSSKLQEFRGSNDLYLVLLMAAIGVAFNPAAAIAVGLPLAFALQRNWITLTKL